jgi:hypothetical protein
VISEADLLTMWEAGQNADRVMRPAALLRAAGADEAPERLPIGARDRRLLALRQEWFGRRAFETVDDCPRCGACVEATFDTPPQSPAKAVAPVVVGELEIEYRLPDTTDLAALAGCDDPSAGRAMLASRCTGRELSDDAIAAIAKAMADADPDGDLRMLLTCPDCEHQWDSLFDPATYFWREVDAAAMRVFREIDALATAYGWTEREILSLPRTRRAAYLALVTS